MACFSGVVITHWQVRIDPGHSSGRVLCDSFKKGPDVPEELVQAHSDGAVVFFCGAGISYPAGLPGFGGLVSQLYAKLYEKPNATEAVAIKEQRYDAAIELLERRLQDRRGVREQVRKILTPSAEKLSEAASIETHKALLALSHGREGGRRLVTTNFDRLFFAADTSHRRFVAPFLPVPKRSKWDGIIYLHGLLPGDEDAGALNRLVVSSGDFGLAYLTERWASRFVSELFRDYVVCFVGYSVSDPVLRYMVDALSADRLLGEAPRDVFAFGAFKKRQQAKELQIWEAKGIRPILYAETSSHAFLHSTLHRWAELYRDGLTGKRLLVSREAQGKPSRVVGDGQVDRVVWALKDPSGAPAKEFADLSPPPPIEWLAVLDEHGLLDRACPVDFTPRLALVGHTNTLRAAIYDKVFVGLSRWFACHLDKAEALAWVIKRGACLHHVFRDCLEKGLRGSPMDPAISRVWEIIASGRACGHDYGDLRFFSWMELLKDLGWNAVRRWELLRLLAPVVNFRPPVDWSSIYKEVEIQPPKSLRDRIKEIVDWDIAPAAGPHLHAFIFDGLSKRVDWSTMLVDLLPGLTAALLETFELMEALGDASPDHDCSYYERPSITDHSQNQQPDSWTILVVLLRDAWVCTTRVDPALAQRELKRWETIRFPIFRRMVLFAATYSEVVNTTEALYALLSRDAWWLWSDETRREVFRLLAAVASRLSRQESDQLIEAIFRGPPREAYRADIQDEQWLAIRDHAIWLRLKKFEVFGAMLSHVAKARLDDLSLAHPKWSLSEDDQEEFAVWTGSGFWGLTWGQQVALPKKPDELSAALLTRPKSDPLYKDDWDELCRTEAKLACHVLAILAEDRRWPVDVWRTALHAFGEETLAKQAWSDLSSVLAKIPDSDFNGLHREIAWWLNKVAVFIEAESLALFVALLGRVLQQPSGEPTLEPDDPVMAALNHPVGHITQALMKVWYLQKPTAGGGLAQSFLPIFTRIADHPTAVYRHGRVILVAHLLALHTADPSWTDTHLIPRFDWSADQSEAKAIWEGYLWTPRINSTLFASSFKAIFLSTAHHYGQLGKHKRIYAQLLVVAALELLDALKPTEITQALNLLPPDGLAEGASVIVRSLGSAEEDRQAYWEHRAKPLIVNLWPKSASKRSSNESAAFAEMCVAAGSAFDDAVSTVFPFLRSSTRVDYIAHLLKPTQNPPRFPKEVLRLLAAILPTEAEGSALELREVLEACIAVDPLLRNTVDYVSLDEYVQRAGA